MHARPTGQPVRVVDTDRRKDGTIVKHVQPSPDHAKIWKDEAPNGEETTFIRVPVSSTSEDRDGDDFSGRGLEAEKTQLDNADIPFYLDHGMDERGMPGAYRALDQEGKWVKGEIEDDVLFGVAMGDPESDAFAEVARKIDVGLPIGFSIGFRDLDSEEKDEGGRQFHDVDLMEVSAVGIPSNPDAVSHQVNVMAKRAGMSPERFLEQVGEALGVEPDTQQHTNPEESPMAEDDETKDAPESGGEDLTEDEVRSMIDEAIEEQFSETADELEERIVGGVTEKLSDVLDKDDDHGEDGENEGGKDADPDETDPAKQGGGEPRGMSTQHDDSPRGGEQRETETPRAKTPGAGQVGPWGVVKATQEGDA